MNRPETNAEADSLASIAGPICSATYARAARQLSHFGLAAGVAVGAVTADVVESLVEADKAGRARIHRGSS